MISKKPQKILILGGTGLVGEELVRQLAQKGNSVVIVSLGSQSDRKTFNKIHKEFPKVKHLTGNVFLPTKYKDRTFNELLGSEEFLDEYLDLIYRNQNSVSSFYLYEVIKSVRPEVIIDSINSATVLSYTRNLKLVDNFLAGNIIKQKAFLATLSMPRLISFFNCLYKALSNTNSVKTYLKIGTSGTGGMGFNIPYTHGENKPSYQLLEKVAISGAFTGLLYVLGNTFGLSEIKEIKPASLVGVKKIGFGKIVLSRNNPQYLKVYRFKNIKKINLKNLKEINFESLKPTGPKNDFSAIFVDTGENGQFSLEEFRTISNPKQMGLVSKEELAQLAVKEISNVETGKNVVKALRKSVVGPTKKGQKLRERIVKEMKKMEDRENKPSLAFEILGPPRLAKLIFEGYLINKRTKENTSGLFKKVEDVDTEDVTLIVSTGLPILFQDQTLLVGRKPKIPESTFSLNDQSVDEIANDGWVDLRNKNIIKWKNRIAEYKKTNKSLEIGDLVAWIFENEDKGFRK